jgi:hypothetical protein
MRVQVGDLHTGAAHARAAGEHAQDSAQHLSQAQLGSGMFGDFAAADSFHDTLSATHAHHIAASEAHRKVLGGVDRRARHVANDFTTMDHANAEAVREVQ